MSVDLRFKILLIPVAILSIALLGMPLLSLRQDNGLERLLRANQEEALVLTAQSISSALKDKSDLFYQEIEESPPLQKDLPEPEIIQLTTPIRLNGDLKDWQPQTVVSQKYGEDHLLVWNPDYQPSSLSFRHLAGAQTGYLYAYFDVTDDTVVYRNRNALKLDRADHLKIIIDKDGEKKNYIVSTFEPGWVIGFQIPEDPQKFATHERRIHGYWRQTDDGYRLEIRIQSELLGDRIVFAVADVDDQLTGNIENIIGTARIEEEKEPEQSVVKKDAIEEILKAQQLHNTRVSILDKDRETLVQIGELKWDAENNESRTRLSGSLPPEIPPTDIAAVFEGESTIVHYYSAEGEGEVMAALQPIYNGEEVLAANITEQALSFKQSGSNRFFRDIMLPLLVAFVVSVVGVFFYSRRISSAT